MECFQSTYTTSPRFLSYMRKDTFRHNPQLKVNAREPFTRDTPEINQVFHSVISLHLQTLQPQLEPIQHIFPNLQAISFYESNDLSTNLGNLTSLIGDDKSSVLRVKKLVFGQGQNLAYSIHLKHDFRMEIFSGKTKRKLFLFGKSR